jgi:hypothetical protein
MNQHLVITPGFSPGGVDLKLLTDVALAFGCGLTDPFLLSVTHLDEQAVETAQAGGSLATDRSHLTVLSAIGLRMRHLYQAHPNISDIDATLAHWLRRGPVTTSRGLIRVQTALSDRHLAMEVLSLVTA